MTAQNYGLSKTPIIIPYFIMQIIWRLPWRIKSLIKKLLPNEIAISLKDYNLCVDLTDEGVCEPIYYTGKYEVKVTDYFRKTIKPGMTVMDIGANIGYYTLLFSNLVGPNGKVFAFEADPINFSFLKKSVEMNKINNIEIVQKAVSDRAGNISLFVGNNYTGASGGHSIVVDNTSGSGESINVEAISIDSYFENKSNKKIDFIKIDIEGAEPLAIKGMTEMINLNHRLGMLTEILPYALEHSSNGYSNYLKMLSDLNFSFNIFTEKYDLEHIGLDELEIKCSQLEGDKYPHFDLVCLKDTSF